MELLELIQKRSEQLQKNSLCRWIQGEESKHLAAEEILGFAPAMLYFILGFRDILQNLEYPNPRHEFEFIINQHCQEDRGHWRWYLEDLSTLGFLSDKWGQAVDLGAETVWADRNRPTRELVYLCIFLIKKHRSAKASLIIIECLEATFGVFMATIKNRFWNSSTYSKLKFFGQIHHSHEMNHSMGHWIENSNDPEETSKSYWHKLHFTAQEQEELMTTVQLIFEQFELVFENWYGYRNAFSRKNKESLVQLELN